PAAAQPDKEEAVVPPEPGEEATGKASLDSKLQQFQRSGDEQKQRIERIASTAKPAAAGARAGTLSKGTRPSKATKGSKKGKGAVPAAKPGQAPGPEARPAAGSATQAPAAKLDKEKDMLPKGFQQELMKNIKGLIKEKQKEAKKPGAD
ncbi:MAG: hypothetical protein JW839_21765, partial [Candidatus Lokiarchaeota archaeon]|nr:hypothetical protein [Candidatus Lokiarchaeota archaeon]